MKEILALLVFGVLMGLIGKVYRNYRSRRFPSLSDSEFLEVFHRHYCGNDGTILDKRSYVAHVLGIPVDKVSPEQTPEELQERIGYITDFYIAWDCLLDDAEEARIEIGLKSRRDQTSTIGDLVADLSAAWHK